MTTPVTPQAGLVGNVSSGNVSAVVFPGNISGGYITNPYLASDQGVAVAHPLYVNPVGNATVQGYGTTFRLEPGQTWEAIPDQTTQTTVNATDAGHRFSAVYW